MNWQTILNAALTAAITGGAGAVIQSQVDPQHANLKTTGSVFAVGALAGLVNLFRKKPAKKAKDVERKP